MNENLVTKLKSSSDSKTVAGRLFVLEVSDSRIHSMRPDGSDRKVVVADCHMPDGIAIDVEAGHIYWTNMGLSVATNDGSIERADLDGGNRRILVPPGATHTPKQLQLDKKNGKLYWCDREGMRVMRANLDGSLIETLVETGRGDADRRDQTRWCVGITIDPVRKQIYWTQKGPDNGEQGLLLRAGLEIPKGETAANRSDIEVFFDHLPEPIDLELDLKNRVLYWTDRGDDTHDGNTLNRARITASGLVDRHVLARELQEGIGVSLDAQGRRAFVTDLGGNVRELDIDTKEESHFTTVAHLGVLTGIDYADI